MNPPSVSKYRSASTRAVALSRMTKKNSVRPSATHSDGLTLLCIVMVCGMRHRRPVWPAYTVATVGGHTLHRAQPASGHVQPFPAARFMSTARHAATVVPISTGTTNLERRVGRRNLASNDAIETIQAAPKLRIPIGSRIKPRTVAGPHGRIGPLRNRQISATPNSAAPSSTWLSFLHFRPNQQQGSAGPSTLS